MNLDKMTLRQILDTPDLPHRLIVYFAAQCAKDAMSKIKSKDQDPRSMTAIDVAERFGNGEDFEQSFLNKTWNDAHAAHAAAYASAYASANAAYATTSAADAARAAADAASAARAAAHAAASATYAARAAAHAAYAAAYAEGEEHYKPLLLDLINKRLTKVEILLLGFHD